MTLTHSILEQLHGLPMSALRLCAWLALLAVIFMPLERWLALREGKPARADLWSDLGYYFLGSLVSAILLSIPLSLVALAAQRLIPATVPATLAALPLAARLGLAFVIGEIGFYWGHRLSHEIPWLWRYHAIHHSPRHMYFLVNTRSHPVDTIVTRLCGMIPLYVLGLAGPTVAGSATPALLILLGTFWGFFIHANLRMRFGALEWIIATPGFHHWHHSRVDHINRNYASMLPVLDQLFGTLHLPRSWPLDYGIEQELAPTFGAQLIEPMRPARKAAPERGI
jgi:sterol desaturase/sphingolipid hydroxylase (fatty acid hydroxylase superfamily)